MHPSDSYLHKLRKIGKQLRDVEGGAHIDVHATVKDAFQSSIPALPGSLADELFDHFSRRLLKGDAGDAAAPPVDSAVDTQAAGARLPSDHQELERLEALADVVDLLCEDYDEKADPLDAADWPIIRDLVSEYAGEMDMRTVSYIMRLVVDHGAT